MGISVVAKKMVEMFLLLFYCGFSALATLNLQKILQLMGTNHKVYFMLVLYPEIAKFDLIRLTAPVSVFGFYAIVYMR